MVVLHVVLLVSYAFYYKNVLSITAPRSIYHHTHRETRCLQHSGLRCPEHSNHILVPTCRVPLQSATQTPCMAASSPLHNDGSASRQPSSHSLHGISVADAALQSHKIELRRPSWSSPAVERQSLLWRPAETIIIILPCLRAPYMTAARGRSLRVRPCPWIRQATTMRRTGGMENKIRTRVARREKRPNSLPP